MSANVLLLSTTILKDRTGVHDNLDEKLLFPEIKAAQDLFIHPLLGTPLFNKIISDVDAGTITGAYKDLLDDYIIDALLNYVLAGLPEAISYQFWNKGVLRKGGDSTELPSMTDLIQISDKYRQRAESYGERLTRYLQANASDSHLPEYLEAGEELDDLIPKSTAFTSPIYLGEHRRQHLDQNNCNCNE